MGCGPSQRSCCTGSLARALNVVLPTKRSAPLVMTGTTWAPAPTRRRHTSTALYAAMPPQMPSTMFVPASGRLSATAGGLVDRAVRRLDLRFRPDDLVGGDLLERDAQRLAGDRRHLGRDHVAEALAELVEVRVDVACPAGGERHEAELRVDAVEQPLDRRGHHRVVRLRHGGAPVFDRGA